MTNMENWCPAEKIFCKLAYTYIGPFGVHDLKTCSKWVKDDSDSSPFAYPLALSELKECPHPRKIKEIKND
jgi:hypothetical protein